MRAGVRVLGPLEAEVGGRPVDLGSPLQRAVLALLLIERGRLVSVDRLIDQLWRGEPPPRAIASLQAYVSNLRRLLEPGRAPRAPARTLVSVPPGYALRLPADAVDAWWFESLLGAARAALPGDPAQARRVLDAALALWRGPAYAGFADEQWAVAEVTRLTELHLAAQETAVDVSLRTGTAAEAAAAAEVLARQHPLREEGWRLLALSLWACGRQADALAALRRARRVLRDELGLDPGPALAGLEDAILHQRHEVLDDARSGPVTAVLTQPAAIPAGTEPGRAEPRDAGLFVGRDAELRAIAATADEARGAGGVILVSAEPGGGKSSLLGQAAGRLAAAGWTVLAGACPDAGGAPPAWAWVTALRTLATKVPPPEHAELAPLFAPAGSQLPEPSPTAAASGRGGPAGGRTGGSGGPPPRASTRSAGSALARFQLHQAVIGWLRAAATSQPVAVLLDDLHNADAETLALLEAVLAGLAGAPVLVLAAYRPAEAGSGLEQTLATAARRSPLRLALPGLPLADAATLISAVVGGPVAQPTVGALAERTGGNPFYLRESARLLASEGELVAMSEVPEGVRDVLRRRLARLPPPAVAVLRLAAVAGPDADVDVLVAAADTDEDGVVTGLEAGVLAGLLTEPSPGWVRFVHALVRDTMSADLTQLRRARMHARLAAAIRALHPDDVTALARHYTLAGSADTAPAAVEYAIRAAELADRGYAYDTTVSWLTQALAASARVPGPGEDRAERDVSLLGRLLRAQVKAGQIAAARATRQRAAGIAAAAGRADLEVAAFAAWTEPTPWQTRPYGFVEQHAVSTLERLLGATDLSPAVRCRLLTALVAELAGEDDPRPARAAEEALGIARALGGPGLLALALAASATAADFEREAVRRGELGAELAAIGERLGQPAYQWYGGYIVGTAAAARGDPAGLRRSLAAGWRLADQYRMAEPLAVQMCGDAMLAHIEGRFADSRRRYADAAGQMRRNGSLHADGFYGLALLTIQVSEGDLAGAEPLARQLHEMVGPLAADAWAVTLAAGGRDGEARAARAGRLPLRPDFFHSVFATLRAMAVIAVGEPGEAEQLLTELGPVAGLVAGAGTASLAMQPVAQTLGELCLFLGRPEQAAGYLRTAEQVAREWGSAHWAARARRALAAA